MAGQKRKKGLATECYIIFCIHTYSFIAIEETLSQLLSTGWNSENYTKTTQSDPPAMEDHPKDSIRTARWRAEILLQLPNEAGGVDMWRGVC